MSSMVHFQQDDGRLVPDSEPFGGNVRHAVGKIVEVEPLLVREAKGGVVLPEFKSLGQRNPPKAIANVGDHESDGATTEELADGFWVEPPAAVRR
jgi:hypothetical protein